MIRGEHGIQCMPCSSQIISEMPPEIQKSVVISLTIQGEHGIQCMPCSSQIISEMPPEIQKTEKCDFFKAVIHFQIMQFSV